MHISLVDNDDVFVKLLFLSLKPVNRMYSLVVPCTSLVLFTSLVPLMYLSCCSMHFSSCSMYLSCCSMHLSCCSMHLSYCSTHLSCCSLYLSCCSTHLSCCSMYLSYSSMHLSCWTTISLKKLHNPDYSISPLQLTTQKLTPFPWGGGWDVEGGACQDIKGRFGQSDDGGKGGGGDPGRLWQLSLLYPKQLR